MNQLRFYNFLESIVSNKTNASAQLNNYREIASAIKKSIEASGRVPPHKSVGAVLYRFLCTVSGNDVTLRSNIWSATDWENATTNASIKYTLTESEHVKWNNVQAAVDTLLSQIVFSNKDDIFGLFLKWIKSEKETSMYTPSGFLPHGITETIKTHNESEKQKTFNLLRRVFKTNYDSTLIHIVNAMAEQPSTEDTFVALSEKAMAELLKHEAENIKSLDPNHMVSSGSEGSWGCEMDMNLFEKIHADPNINYLNIHIWPYNWSWVKADSLKELLPRAKENTKKYIDDHMVIARKYSKPIVLEEFGFPRDGFSFSKEAPTTARDEYYRYVFDLIRQDRESGGLFAGCNFWAWGGFAGQNPDHVFWEKGDDYTGDPAQEQQGLNSVFATDSTIEIIKAENRKLQN
jgi:endo-1,4-beta-mannosidase